jgi:hypothetical protein
MILETIIGALVPVGIDGIKSLIGMVTGGVKPISVDEQIKLDQNEINKLQAIAQLDNPYGTPSQWVIDLRASSRYLGALFVIVVGIGTLFLSVTSEIQRIGIEAANIAFGFLFGTRIMANLKK